MRYLLLATALAAGFGGAAWAAGPTQGVTDKEIVIGTYTDLSGVTVAWGVNNSNAWRMAFDEANAAGGIDGRMIKYIVEDNQYQVPRSIQAANKLINRDHVFFMVGNGGTPMNNAVMPDQLAKNVANIFPLTSARSMYEPFNHLKFGLLSSYYDQMRAAVKYFVEKKGKKKLCGLSQDTDFGRDVMAGVYDQVKAMGLTLTAETKHRPTDTDFTASAAKLHDAGCDVVFFGTIVRDTIQAMSAIRKMGWNVDIVGQVASYDSAVAEVPGGITEGYYAMTSFILVSPDDPRPAVHAFVEKYKKLYGKDPNPAAQVGYTAGAVVIQALKNAGRDLTVDSFIAGLEKIKNFHDIFGSPPITFGPDRHWGSNESFLAEVKGGKWIKAIPEPIGY
jgi:branched-chain amino acid transport system substrate-binding protein